MERKVYIPVNEHPGRNFVGLIIGPRGNTLRTLEQNTGCKIAIRGKGSTKVESGQEDQLHVLIKGPSEQALDNAESQVQKILFPDKSN